MPEDPGRSARLERAVQRLVGRRRGAAAAAVLLLAAIFAAGLVVDDPREPGAVLYAVPVGLLALAFGTWVGAAGGIAAGGLYWVAGQYHDTSFSAAHLGYRVGTLVVLGATLGALATRLVATELDARRLLELAHEGIWTVDVEGRTTYANPRLAELLGTTQAELLRSPPSRWLAPGEPFAERLARRSRGLAEAYEARFVRADGTELWAAVAAAPVVDARGRVHGSLALVSDVTDRRRAEEELRRSEGLLAQAQRIAGLGSWEWDVRADVVTWSDELYRIFGLAPGELEATYEGFIARVHPDDRARVDEAVRASLAGRTPFAFTHRVLRPDGGVRVLESRGAVSVEDDEVVRMAGTGHDVTDRVEVEQRLAVAAERRRGAVELNDTIVQGLAVAAYGLADDRSEAADAVRAALARAKELVADLLGDEPPQAGSLRRERGAGTAFTPFEQ